MPNAHQSGVAGMIIAQAKPDPNAMKTLLLLASMSAGLAAVATPQQADSTGLAGDQFSLRGALELFRQSKDLDAFEKSINATGNGVNNLDLDGNGEVDFIHVRASADAESRVVVLQAAFGKDDQQDIATIQMERGAEATVTLQILGDAMLYPENTIVEPSESIKEQEGKRGGPLGPAAQVTVWMNVWAWPCVQWCYGPGWWEWSSPWYWGYYPGWWNPWRPWGWSMWWGYPRPYWGWYQPVHFCRVNHANSVYMHRRSMSGTVQRRNDVRPAQRAPSTRPMERDDRAPGIDRGKQPTPPVRTPGKPERKPAERTAPSRPPHRTAPAPQPSRSSPAAPPSRPPQRAPTKR